MSEINLPAHAPEIPEGSVFIPQDEADVAALVAAAGDRHGEIQIRAGYGVVVPADIAGATAPEPEAPADAPAKGAK